MAGELIGSPEEFAAREEWLASEAALAAFPVDSPTVLLLRRGDFAKGYREGRASMFLEIIEGGDDGQSAG